MPDNERLLTIEEVAARLQLSPLTVGDMLRDGRMPGFKLGRLWRVREEDLDRYIRDKAAAGEEAQRARAAKPKRPKKGTK
jgi:excisionase family DNA binding protein